MIGTELWRARIGHFCLSIASWKRSCKSAIAENEIHEKKASVIDIVCGYAYLCFLVAVLYYGTFLWETAMSVPVSNSVGEFHGQIGTMSACENETMSMPMSIFVGEFHGQIGAMNAYENECKNSTVSMWRILLSNDVETQPGPLSLDSLQESINKLEDKMMNAVADVVERCMEKQLGQIVEAVKCQSDAIRRMEESQKNIEEKISRMCRDLNETKQMINKNTAAIDSLANEQDSVNEMLVNLQDEVDRLEGFSKRNNIRLYGIPEPNTFEDYNSCINTVHRVLNTYFPDSSFEINDIERAHRIGQRNPNSSNPRPMVIRFQRWRDAMRLMTNHDIRAKMQSDGLRVAQDLTRRQASRLRELKNEGKVGYYVNGRLRIRHPDQRFHRDQRITADRNQQERRDQPSPRRSPDHTTRDSPGREHTTRSSPDRHAQPVTHPATSPRRQGPINSADLMGQHDVTPAADVTVHGESAVKSAQPRPRTRSAASGERQTSIREAWGAKRTGNTARKCDS